MLELSSTAKRPNISKEFAAVSMYLHLADNSVFCKQRPPLSFVKRVSWLNQAKECPFTKLLSKVY